MRHDSTAPSPAELTAFRDSVLAQLDHARPKHDNDGPLNLDLNDTSLYACKWVAPRPVLPPAISRLVPFGPDELVTIHARYRYGSLNAMINIWISGATDGDHRSFSLGLRVDPHTHAVDTESRMNGLGCDSLGRDETAVEAKTWQVMGAIFAGNPDYEERHDRLDIVDAFRLGISSQADLGAELYTLEVAQKRLQTPTGEFWLTVSVLDRTHPAGKPSRLTVNLFRSFRPTDHDSQGIFSGSLDQKLVVNTEPGDTAPTAERQSKVMLANEPAITPMAVTRSGQAPGTPRPTPVTLLNDATDDEIPPGLRSIIYPDDQPTRADLAFFHRLVTQPIRIEDTTI